MESLGIENLTDYLSIVICITIEPEANKQKVQIYILQEIHSFWSTLDIGLELA